MSTPAEHSTPLSFGEGLGVRLLGVRLLGVRLYLLWRGGYLPLLHAAGQTEGRGDGGEDGDNHVDNHLPGFFLVFEGHSY